MASRQDLTLNEANDEMLRVAVSSNVSGFTLVGKSLEAYVKATAGTADNDAGTWKGSTTTGEVVIVDAGNCTVAIPGSALTTTKGWWRLDVIDTGKRKTAAFGTLTIVDM